MFQDSAPISQQTLHSSEHSSLRNLGIECADIIHSLGDAFVMIGLDGAVEYMNGVAADLLCIDLATANESHPNYKQLFNIVEGNLVVNVIESCLQTSSPIRLPQNAEIIRADGNSIAASGIASPVVTMTHHLKGCSLLFRDVTKERETLSLLEYQATHDMLTGLANRVLFEEKLKVAMAQAQNSQSKESAVLLLDLDHFKRINDTYGHLAGDHVLQQIADLLLHATRVTDLVVRLGGDEFAVLLYQCPVSYAIDKGKEIVEQIHDKLFTMSGQNVRLNASIGLSVLSQEKRSIQEVLKNADLACYEAKRAGRGRLMLETGV